MGDTSLAKRVFVNVTLCLIWFLISSATNIVGKLVLNDFPYPLTVAMVHLLSIVVLTGPVCHVSGVKDVKITKKHCLIFIIPLAFTEFFVTLFTQASVWNVPVSFANTVKATLPLFTVALSRILVGEKHTLNVYLSLLPIVAGVIIASVTEISFNLVGFISALLSILSQSVQHIYSKQVMCNTEIHHLRLMQTLGKWAFLMFLPFWMYIDMNQFKPLQEDVSYGRVIGLLCLASTLNWLQKVMAFSFLSMVSPLTYAVASSGKRLAVLASSLIFLQNPVTPVNVMGMMLAIFGVLAYNKAKYDQRRDKNTVPTNNDKNKMK